MKVTFQRRIYSVSLHTHPFLRSTNLFLHICVDVYFFMFNHHCKCNEICAESIRITFYATKRAMVHLSADFEIYRNSVVVKVCCLDIFFSWFAISLTKKLQFQLHTGFVQYAIVVFTFWKLYLGSVYKSNRF